MEGVAPLEELRLLELGNDGDFFLAADVTEYFGEEATFDEQNPLDTAQRVVISQLKYSTRHPNRSWTTSRIADNSDKDGVLRTFAKSYTQFREIHSRELLIKKLRFALVSNQQADGEFVKSLKLVQDILDTKFSSNQATVAQVNILLRAKKAPEAMQNLAKLHQASGLSSREFTDFLRLLDLSDCGTEARLKQRANLFAEVASHVALDAEPIMRRLCERLYEEALPNAERSYGLSRRDILAQMGVGSEDELFPAPNSFEPLPTGLVPSPDALALAQFLIDTPQVLAHGPAGIGKTTTMRLLCEHLPAQSIVILFDCFDGGNYLHRERERHTHRTAFTQLANELSLSCGTPLLVSASENVRVLLKWWQRALQGASRLIKESSNNKGLLVIIIDAADNLAEAARSLAEDWFVPSLWDIDLPPNVRLVVSARSSRRNLLKAPAGTSEFPLQGFDEDSSGQYFDKHFPGSGQYDRLEWHKRTGGIPRIQFYVVQEARRNNWNTPSLLWNDWPDIWKLTPPDSFGLGTIFEITLGDAVSVAADARQGERALAMLALLRRPIPRSLWQDAAGFSDHTADLFFQSLKSGVIIEQSVNSQFITMRDEDFETHLRQHASDKAPGAQKELAVFLKSKANSHPYAAEEAAEHLLATGQIEELLEITFDGSGLQEGRDGSLPVITDEVARVRIQRHRLKLALRGISEISLQAPKRLADAAKVLILLAESVRTHKVVENLVHSAPDLALRFGDAALIRKVILLSGRDDENSIGVPSLARVHLQLAAHYSHDPNTHALAQKHFNDARAWIRSIKSSKQENGLSVADLAAGAEAVLYLEGASSAADWLRSWRPIPVVFDALEKLAQSVASRHDEAQLESWLDEKFWPRWAEAVLTVALWQCGRLTSKDRLIKLSDRLGKHVRRRGFPRIHPDGSWPNATYRERDYWTMWALNFAELLVRCNIKREHCLFWLELGTPKWPGRAPQDEADRINYFRPLRARVLKSVLSNQVPTAVSLLPDNLRAESNVVSNPPPKRPGDESSRPERNFVEEERLEDRSKYLLFFEALLPWVLLRSRVLVERPNVSDLEVDFERLFKLVEGFVTTSGDSSRENTAFRHREMLTLFTDSLLNCEETYPADSDQLGDHLERLIRLLPNFVGDSSPWSEMDLASRLITRHRYWPLASRLLDHATSTIFGLSLPASEKRDALLRGARLSCTFDEMISRKLFRRAVETSASVDDDSTGALDLLARTIPLLKSSISRESLLTNCARLVALLEGFKPYIAEDYGIPWHHSLEGIMQADSPAGLALALRWEESCQLSFRESVPLISYAGLESDNWSPLISLYLLYLRGVRSDPTAAATYRSGETPRSLIKILEKLHSQGLPGRQALGEALGVLSHWVRCYVPGNQRQSAAERIVSWAQKHRLSTLKAVQDLEKTADFARSLKGQQNFLHEESVLAERRSLENGRRKSDRRKKLEIDELEVRAAKGDASDFSSRWHRYEHLSRQEPGKSQEVFLTTTRRALIPGQRVTFLKELAKIEWSKEDTDILSSCLKYCLEDWQLDYDVQQWVREDLKSFINYHLHPLLGYEHTLRQRLTSLLSWPGINVQVLLGAVANNSRQCSPQALFIIAEILVQGQEISDIPSVWEWVAERNEERLKFEGHSVEALDWSHLPATESKALANFFWILWGHPDREIRWDVLHAARGMLSSPFTAAPCLLSEVVSIMDTEDSGLMGTNLKAPEFFWMSARVYGLLLLQELARLKPRELVPHGSRIIAWALNDQFPHVQIRELAKLTALQIEEKNPGTFDSSTLQQLNRLNQPLSLITDEKISRRHLGWMQGREESSKLAFKFDEMDTLPDWYDGLDQIFGLDNLETAQRADRWISNVWCRTSDEFWGDQATWSNSFWSRYGWENTSHRHGSIPRVEVPVRYYEYHAMQCAAGEMIALFPVYQGPSAMHDEPWKYWLAESTCALELGWVSDYRSPVPLQLECWGQFPPEEQWSQRSDSDYQSVLGLSTSSPWFVVAADFAYAHVNLSGGTRVDCALVNPELATSLVSALQNANANDFRLPLDGEKDANESPLNANVPRGHPFSIVGWIDEPRIRHNSPDTFDPWGKVLRNEHLRPSRDFISFWNLTPQLSSDGGLEYISPENQVLSRSQAWRDSNAQESYDEMYTDGQILQVKLDAFLDFLKALQLDWIGRVVLKRNYTDRYRRYKRDELVKPYDSGQHRVYRLQSDGTLSWLGGSLKVGSGNR